MEFIEKLKVMKSAIYYLIFRFIITYFRLFLVEFNKWLNKHNFTVNIDIVKFIRNPLLRRKL